MPTRKLCNICGADLDLWRETFGEEHVCPTPEMVELAGAAKEALEKQERNNQSSLNQLLGEFQAKGYRLLESGRLYKLFFYDDLVFGFDSDIPATKATIQTTCWLHELKIKGGGKI